MISSLSIKAAPEKPEDVYKRQSLQCDSALRNVVRVYPYDVAPNVDTTGDGVADEGSLRGLKAAQDVLPGMTVATFDETQLDSLCRDVYKRQRQFGPYLSWAQDI